ncbi:MAG: hypothetical protein OXJ53_08705 [Gammaproteobacteria bacterium]|nr:hypothetical protein [Gammaproteobacteria bacterium]
MDSKETRQVVQLLERSGRPVKDVLQEVLGMRPVVERRHVFIGSVSERSLSKALQDTSQRERDAMLQKVIDGLGLEGASGRLGTNRFTLVGDESFGSSISKIGKERLEGLLCEAIAKELKRNVATYG